MAKKKNKHDGPHKYEKAFYGKNDTVIYRCVLPNCPHFLNPTLVPGRISLCWGTCNGEVMITKEDIVEGRRHPMCDRCREERRERRESLALTDVENI